MKTRGFTLIELLVVIAIIGLLASAVLAGLATARSRANDASVRANLHAIQSQAELYYLNNASSYGTQAYSTACAAGMFADATVVKAKAGADTANGAGNVYCYAGTTGYLVAADLSSGYWCIDQTGAQRGPTVGAAPATIPAGNVCP